MSDTKLVEPVQLGTRERCIAAAGAALLATLVVNPLDVVKTRMQAQGSAAHRPLAPMPSLMTMHQYALGGMVHSPASLWGSPAQPMLQRSLSTPPTYRSSLDGLWKITRHEGLPVLWHGVNVSMLISVPAICLYLPLYDHLLKEIGPSNPYAPLLAGALARTVSVVATSPLDLLRTRIQAAGGASSAQQSPLMTALQRTRSDLKGTASQQVSSLWRGVGASLFKDVPFAALFWSFLEPSRSWLNSHIHIPHTNSSIDVHTLLINAISGSAAGAAAAGITTPFDVVKTRLQTRETAVARQSTWRCLVEVAQEGGVRGVFSGWGPRTLRTAAAYSILMSSYEICKGAYKKQSDMPQ